MNARERVLVLLLRFSGGVMLLAFVAVFQRDQRVLRREDLVHP